MKGLGELRKQIWHLSPVLVGDGQGGHEELKIERKGFFWAQVTELEPTSLDLAGKDVRIARYQIRTRARSICVSDQLEYGGRILEIDYIKELDGAPPYIEITCKEVRQA